MADRSFGGGTTPGTARTSLEFPVDATCPPKIVDAVASNLTGLWANQVVISWRQFGSRRRAFRREFRLDLYFSSLFKGRR